MKELKHISRIHKKLSEGLSESEINEHNAWLKEDSSHKRIESEIAFAWDHSASYEPKVDFDPEAAFNKFKFKKESIDKVADKEVLAKAKVVSLNPRKWIYGLTACIVFGLVSMFVFNTNEDASQHYTAVSSKIEVLLSDNSKIVLAEGSSLDVASDFGKDNRTTTLIGKAYFDIERNEDKPFIIETQNGNIEVLGTAFNLSSIGTEVVLEVEEGLVAFTRDNTKELFKVGEKLVYQATSNKLDRSAVESTAVFAWKNTNLKFIKTSLPDVFIQLSNYFNIEFEYSNESLREKAKVCSPITITNIKDPQLTEILNVLKEVSGIEYRMVDEDKKVRIIGLSCS